MEKTTPMCIDLSKISKEDFNSSKVHVLWNDDSVKNLVVIITANEDENYPNRFQIRI